MVVFRQSEVRFWVALRTTHTNQHVHARIGLGTSIFALGTHDDPIFVSDYNVGTEGEGTKRQPSTLEGEPGRGTVGDPVLVDWKTLSIHVCADEIAARRAQRARAR